MRLLRVLLLGRAALAHGAQADNVHGPPLAHSAAAELAHTKSAYHPFRLPQRTLWGTRLS